MSDRMADWLSPGASCTVAQNELDKAIGRTATTIATGGLALRGAEALRAARAVYVARAEQIAATSTDGRTAVALRNALKDEARQQMPTLLRLIPQARNYLRYGNTLGPTYEELLAKYGSDEAVIAAAGRTSSFWNGFLLGSG